MSILSELQDQYQPKIPRLDVFSKHYAGIVHDVVQVNLFGIFVSFNSGINRQEEYRLSLA